MSVYYNVNIDDTYMKKKVHISSLVGPFLYSITTSEVNSVNKFENKSTKAYDPCFPNVQGYFLCLKGNRKKKFDRFISTTHKGM